MFRLLAFALIAFLSWPFAMCVAAPLAYVAGVTDLETVSGFALYLACLAALPASRVALDL